MNDSPINVTGFMPGQLPATTADGTKQPVILQQITIRPVNRQSQDIKKWRAAHRSAEGYIKRRVMLYDLYADVVLDGHYIGTRQKLLDSLTDADWTYIDKDGNPVDEINQLIESDGWDDLLEVIYDTDDWGYSTPEFTFYKDFEGKSAFTVYQCDRRHMRPEFGIIAFDQNGDDGINIREGIYPSIVMEIGKANDMGKLISIAQYAILKDGDLSDWAAFVQTYGQPLLDAEWDGFDESQRIKLQDSLFNMGSGGVIIRPAGTKLSVVENRANSDGKLQGNLFDTLNKEISKIMLTATESTESSNSSGYAQSQTHEDMESNRKKALIKTTRKLLNKRFRKILAAQGFDLKGGTFMVKPGEEELSQKDSYPIHKSMKVDLKIPISDDFFYKKYGVDKPEDYDKQKALLLAQNNVFEENQEPNNPENPAPTPPANPADNGQKPPVADKAQKKKALVKLRDAFFDFFGSAPAIAATGAMMTIGCCGMHQAVNNRFVTLADKTNNNAFLQRIWDGKGKTTFDAGTFQFTTKILLDGLHGGWKGNQLAKLADDISFAYGVDDPSLLTAFEMNLFRFGAGKTLAEVQKLNELYRQSKSFDDFLQKAQGVTDVFNKGQLQTEYNTAYFVGEASATYTRLLKQVKTFPYWEYKTVGDDKVRPSHRALEGLILPANDPRWDRIYPPNGWNCRCYVVPRTRDEVKDVDLKAMRQKADDYFASPEFKTNQAQGWGVNRAKTGEVFTANQQYTRKFPGKASKTLDKLGASDFGLPSYSNAKKAATATAPEYTDDAQSFFEAQKAVDGEATLRDYNNRPLLLDEDNFDFHTTGKKADRVQYLEAMNDTLKSPDEVWLNGYKGGTLDNLVYVKYYKDMTMIVVANVNNSNVTEVSTWFPLTEDKTVISRIRRGLLVMSK
jgi:SPP1 gp7 family putative phage head morphogenesis protein